MGAVDNAAAGGTAFQRALFAALLSASNAWAGTRTAACSRRSRAGSSTRALGIHGRSRQTSGCSPAVAERHSGQLDQPDYQASALSGQSCLAARRPASTCEAEPSAVRKRRFCSYGPLRRSHRRRNSSGTATRARPSRSTSPRSTSESRARSTVAQAPNRWRRRKSSDNASSVGVARTIASSSRR